MRYLLALIFIAIVAAIIIFSVIKPALGALAQRRRQRVLNEGVWTVDEDESDGFTQVRIIKPGEEPIRVNAPIPHKLRQFEYQDRRAEAMIEAEAMAQTKNSRF